MPVPAFQLPLQATEKRINVISAASCLCLSFNLLREMVGKKPMAWCDRWDLIQWHRARGRDGEIKKTCRLRVREHSGVTWPRLSCLASLTASGVPNRATLSPAGADIEAGRVTPDVQGHPESHSWNRTRTQDRRERTFS